MDSIVPEKMVVGSTTLAFSVGVTFVSVVLFTRDFRLAIFTTLTTVLCNSTFFGIRVSVLKWKFGPLEPNFLTTFVGLSMDYMVHVACLQPILNGDPAAKVEEALARGQCCVERCHDHLSRFVVPLAVLDFQSIRWYCYEFVTNIDWITDHSYIIYGSLAYERSTFMFESLPT